MNKEMQPPLISIFVPTKNRYTYLEKLISLIEGYKDSRIELIIHDNSDSNVEILRYLNTMDLLSTKYYYYQGYLTMSENSTKAFQYCRGEYVCMIGDDDAVCRNIAECAEWMKANGVDSLRSTNLHFDYGNSGPHLLYWEDISPTYSILDPQKELKIALKNGLVDFGNISKPYHGILKREVLQKVFEIGGTCFPGCTPDMSGAVSSCFFVKKMAKVNIPVIIPAASPVDSGGLAGQILSLEEVPWISQNVRDNWERKIPRIWAREFIWPESGSKGLRYTGHDDMFKYFNYNMTYCRYILMHKQHRKEVIQFAPNKFLLLAALFKTICMVGIKKIVNRSLMSRITGKLNGKYNFSYNCRDLSDVVSYFSDMNTYPFSELKLK